MVTTENELNTTLGILFKGFKSDWHIKAEQTRQLKMGVCNLLRHYIPEAILEFLEMRARI